MKKKHIAHKSQTDWDRVDKLRDKDIDFSDNPEVTAAMFAKAVLRKGLKPVVRKTQVTLRIDEDVLTWFKKEGSCPFFEIHYPETSIRYPFIDCTVCLIKIDKNFEMLTYEDG